MAVVKYTPDDLKFDTFLEFFLPQVWLNVHLLTTDHVKFGTI